MNFRTRVIQTVIATNERILFYPALRRFYASRLRGKCTIIDVGSNKGQSIDFFLKVSPGSEIWGFEPNKKLHDRLLKKYQGKSGIHLNNTGVSDRPGILTFYENVLDETSTFEKLNPQSAYLTRKARILGVRKEEIIVDSYETEVTTLAMYLNERIKKEIDVVKIDVEGHEFQVLKGLFSVTPLSYPVRFIQTEHHEDDMYLDSGASQIRGLMRQNGFREVARFKHGFGEFYEIIYENIRF